MTKIIGTKLIGNKALRVSSALLIPLLLLGIIALDHTKHAPKTAYASLETSAAGLSLGP